MNKEPLDRDSDTDNDSITSSNNIYEQIDTFISDETDYIMDLYYEIQDRIPYFLDKMRFHHLLHLIVDLRFNIYKNKKRYNEKNLDYFDSEYKQEIIGVLYLINNYLTKYKKFQIEYDTFFLFAYDFTTIL